MLSTSSDTNPNSFFSVHWLPSGLVEHVPRISLIDRYTRWNSSTHVSAPLSCLHHHFLGSMMKSTHVEDDFMARWSPLTWFSNSPSYEWMDGWMGGWFFGWGGWLSDCSFHSDCSTQTNSAIGALLYKIVPIVGGTSLKPCICSKLGPDRRSPGHPHYTNLPDCDRPHSSLVSARGRSCSSPVSEGPRCNGYCVENCVCRESHLCPKQINLKQKVQRKLTA